MNKKLRKSIEYASQKIKEAQIAANEVIKSLTFCGFGESEPIVTIKGNAEIYLSWNGYEMSIQEAVERMEEYGYINKGDFCDEIYG